MRITNLARNLTVLALGFFCISATQAIGQDSSKSVVEPIYRLSKNIGSSVAANDTKNESSASTEGKVLPVSNDRKIEAKPAVAENIPHPLDRALEIANSGLENIQTNIKDYTAIMVKRERINGELLDPEFMNVKIRNNHKDSRGREVPFSIYMKFLKPRATKGREVIWVKGRNAGKIIAHEAGFKGLITVRLDPNGSMAMTGNRYPIYDAGIENLVNKLLEKGTRDRAAGMCEVRYVENTSINKRPCTMIEVIHPEQKAPYEFHKAQIFIDNELQIPVRYAAYLWPATPGGKPQLLEEYTYVNVALNVGLSDADFDHKNPKYSYK